MPQHDRSELDPITVEVVRHKLEGIANEMQSTLLRSSFSPIVKEGLDASASLFTPDGTTLAQSCSIPIHLATLIPAVAAVLQAYPVATMRGGDAFILNDPYSGGTHLPDIAVVMPVFHCGRVIALSAAMTHHQDVGGMTAGSVPTNATEIFQEGLRIPPLKLRDAGVLNETLLVLLRRNVRIPETVMGDLNAQIAACTVGVRRIPELAERYGDNQLTVIAEELLRRSELMTRQALREIPEGTYRFVDFLDNDGIELERQIRIEVAVTLSDGAIDIDFAGTSPQVRGPFNCVPSGSLAAACWAVRALTDPKIPTNGGCFRPISLRLPQGSLVNPEDPAPVNARTSTIKRIAGCIVGALAPVMPEKAPAASAGELLVLAFGGRRPDGARYVVGELIAGGSGAGAGTDGVDVIETDATNCMNLPAEAMEMEALIRIHRVALRRDSGGPGEWRGGLGTVREYEVLDGEVSFSHRGERHFSAAPGLAGGGSGASARSVIRRADGSEEVIPSKTTTTLGKGDRLVVETAGGGGYGDPRRRQVDRVEADIRNGKVSLDATRTIYGQLSLAPDDAEREQRDLALTRSGPSLASGLAGRKTGERDMSKSGTHHPPEFKRAADMEWEMGRFGNVTKFLFHPRPDRPTEPNAGFLKYAPGASFPLHRHDFAQVWYIIEGEFTFGGKHYGPGTIAYMPDPHFEHEMYTATGGTIFFVQYPGPTTGAPAIYDGRMNLKEAPPLVDQDLER